MADSPEKPKYTPTVSATLNALFADTEGSPNPLMASVTSLQLIQNCLLGVNEIYRRAKTGDEESTDYLFRLANRIPMLLMSVARTPSPLLLEMARSNPTWPFWYSPKANMLAEYADILRSLEVGRDCQLNVSRKARWSWEGEARKWAFMIWQEVQSLKANVQGLQNDFPNVHIEWTELTKAAWNLPPLTKETVKLWMAAVGWPLVMVRTEGHPEKHPQLRKLGRHREGHTATSARGSKTSESNIRDGIKKLITQALRNMASTP